MALTWGPQYKFNVMFLCTHAATLSLGFRGLRGLGGLAVCDLGDLWFGNSGWGWEWGCGYSSMDVQCKDYCRDPLANSHRSISGA